MAAIPEKIDMQEANQDPPGITLQVNGQSLICDSAGCLYWPEEKLLVVSDLHLEKGSSFAAKRQFLPPYDTQQTLRRLEERLAIWQPEKVISLGDSFHDETASERLSAACKDALEKMMVERQWIWICGNHDPAPPQGLKGTAAREVHVGKLAFRHIPNPGDAIGEVAGHLHPAGKIRQRSKTVRRPCFVSDGRRLIMPSFGSFTGGLNIRHSAFDGLFDEQKLSAVLIGNQRLHHIAARNLVA